MNEPVFGSTNFSLSLPAQYHTIATMYYQLTALPVAATVPVNMVSQATIELTITAGVQVMPKKGNHLHKNSMIESNSFPTGFTHN